MALVDEIFLLNDKERRKEFEEVYMFKFGRLANYEADEARKLAVQRIMGDPKLMEEFEASEVWKKALQTGFARL